MNLYEERKKRTEWFLESRFGMFIHWGLYSLPARGEWVRSTEHISDEKYREYFEEFDPVSYNPRDWAKAAKKAGMKYAVMTAKHHEGFCLFDSKLTDFKATNTKAGRDLVREYLEAFRAEGLKVGLYYSLIDWQHPDYPAFGDPNHPMKDNPAYKRDPARFGNYLEYMHGQVEELCGNYGKIDILWFDFSYGDMTGEVWKASELVQKVRKLQPHIIIDNRLEASGEHYGSMTGKDPKVYSGDFASPEQIVPPEGVVDDAGRPLPWEACVTMNNFWGYASADRNYKSPRLIVRKLVECVSKNGNLLLNVGPDAHGKFPTESTRILETIGNWMEANGRSIYGCGKPDFPKPEWGYYTQRGKTLYAHVFDANIGALPLTGLKGKAKKARLLSDGSELPFVDAWNTRRYERDLFVSFGPEETFTYPLPDDTDTVLEIDLH